MTPGGAPITQRTGKRTSPHASFPGLAHRQRVGIFLGYRGKVCHRLVLDFRRGALCRWELIVRSLDARTGHFKSCPSSTFSSTSDTTRSKHHVRPSPRKTYQVDKGELSVNRQSSCQVIGTHSGTFHCDGQQIVSCLNKADDQRPLPCSCSG